MNNITPTTQKTFTVPVETHKFFEKEAREWADSIIKSLAENVLIKKEPAGWSSYLPSLPSWLTWKSAGGAAGHVAGMVHGQGVMNQGIELVAMKALQTSLGSWGAKGAAEGLKAVASTWLTPYLPTVFSFAGAAMAGAAGAMLGAGASYLVSYITKNNDPKTLAMMSESDVQEFLEQNKAEINKELIHLAGKVLHQEIYAKLYECKTNHDVINTLETYVIHRQPLSGVNSEEAIVLKDGYVLNSTEAKQYKSLIKNFSRNTMSNNGGLKENKTELKAITKLLAIHTAKASSEKAQERKVGDVVIQCKDGIFCQPDGKAIDQADAELTFALDRFVKQVNAQIEKEDRITQNKMKAKEFENLVNEWTFIDSDTNISADGVPAA